MKEEKELTLRTLKDLEYFTDDCGTRVAYYEQLRQAAREHIQHLRKIQEVETFKDYVVIQQATIDWIKMFFNLEEEGK